jgi:transposase
MEKKYKKAKTRAAWLKTYEELGCVSKAAKRCGIARSTLYRWLARYENKSQEELLDHSQKPKKLANQKIDSSLKALILLIRQDYGFGPQRISTHLLGECARSCYQT